ncbi:MAG: ATP-dependent Clp protease adaptor ClpS [Actinobacteria bacterium]|nr:ATP-dependent Clp protease adaptor ClpS [Actinomycetota bacterium]
MSYVTHVFTSYFGYAEAKATELMLQVHNNGKAAVSGGSRENRVPTLNPSEDRRWHTLSGAGESSRVRWVPSGARARFVPTYMCVRVA